MGILIYDDLVPYRNIVLATNEIYHLFNRSIAKQYIFSSALYLRKLVEVVEYYRFPQRIRLSQFKLLPEEVRKDYFNGFKNQKPLVEIYCFSFMPNHYHFLLKQLSDNGIKRFAANMQNSFAKYFNLKSDRNGSLFQNRFKAKRIETDEQFTHVSRYIHLNPVTSYIIELRELAKYPWTSFPNYINESKKDTFINNMLLLKMFKSRKQYRDFVFDQADYQRQLDIIKHLI